VHMITGMGEPQGVGYVPATDTLYVANARDGTVALFRGETYAPSGTIKLGGDADNIRYDPDTNHVLVGYGGRAIAVIDAASNRKVGDIALPAHPEGFRLAPGGSRIYVNLPNARAIGVVDVAAGKQIASWPTQVLSGNFAMILDEDGRNVIVAFRNAARAVAFSPADGSIVASADTCGDIDDVFVDA